MEWSRFIISPLLGRSCSTYYLSVQPPIWTWKTISMILTAVIVLDSASLVLVRLSECRDLFCSLITGLTRQDLTNYTGSEPNFDFKLLIWRLWRSNIRYSNSTLGCCAALCAMPLLNILFTTPHIPSNNYFWLSFEHLKHLAFILVLCSNHYCPSPVVFSEAITPQFVMLPCWHSSTRRGY